MYLRFKRVIKYCCCTIFLDINGTERCMANRRQQIDARKPIRLIMVKKEYNSQNLKL